MKPQHITCQNCAAKRLSLFDHCTLGEREKLSHTKSTNAYKKGQYVFNEGGQPQGLYCISTGVVKLVKMGSNGKEQILRISKPGDFIGYRSLLSDSRYRASAVALEDMRVCLIPKTEFWELLRTNAQIHEGIMRMLCEIVDEANAKMTEIAYKPVRGRIAEALILLNEAFKSKGSIQLTREDLASFVGTVKETAIRTISEFKHEKLIEVEKRNIKVINPEGLMRISNLYD